MLALATRDKSEYPLKSAFIHLGSEAVASES